MSCLQRLCSISSRWGRAQQLLWCGCVSLAGRRAARTCQLQQHGHHQGRWPNGGAWTPVSVYQHARSSSSSRSSRAGCSIAHALPGRSPWPWPSVAGVALAVGFAAAPVSAYADSSTHQQQQALAAEAAAEHAKHRATQQHAAAEVAGGDGQLDDGRGAVVHALVAVATGFSRLLDSLEELYLDLELRLTSFIQHPDEPVLSRLLAFAGSLLPVVAASGLTYCAVSDTSPRAALYKMYCLLCRAPAAPEPNIASYAVVNLVYLFGFFTIAVLLGVVNDEVAKRAEDQRSGRLPVRAANHVLLLGWNGDSKALLHNIGTAVQSSIGLAGSAVSSSTDGGAAGDLWHRKPVVVVLADQDKAEMDAVVQEVLRERGLTDLVVHTRKGRPFSPSALRRVSAHDAAVVLLLHPEGVARAADGEAWKAATTMALTTLLPSGEGAGGGGSSCRRRRHQQQQRVIVQTSSSVPPDGNVLAAVQSTSAFQTASGAELQVQVLALPDALLTNRIVAQTAVQPGVLTVWLDILSPSALSSNFKTMLTPPKLQQQPYGAVRRSFIDDVVCGFMDASGRVVLNPSDAAIVPGPNSRLIMLTHRTPSPPSETELAACRGVYEQAAAAATQRLQRAAHPFTHRPRSILVAAWDDAQIPELASSLKEFSPAQSTVTFVTAGPVSKAWPSRLGTTRFSYISHPHPTSLTALKAAGLRNADCVVLGTGPGQPTDTEADARVLAALVQVQEAIQVLNMRTPHCVAPIRETGSSAMALRYLDGIAQQQQQQQQQQATRAGWLAGTGQQQPQQLADTVIKPEFLIFRDITTSVVCQAAAEPEAYAAIISSLLCSAQGNEVYLRPPVALGCPLGETISFAHIQELARRSGQTALGVIHTGNVAAETTAADGSSGGSDSIGGGMNEAAAATAGTGPPAMPAQQTHGAPLHHLSSVAAALRLGMPATEQVVLRDGDFIVVLAYDF